MKKNHILWYDLYLLLRHEIQHQNTPTSVNCYHPGSWKALRKLNKGSKCCFVLHQNWSYCLLPFSLNVFLQCFLYYHLAACWVCMLHPYKECITVVFRRWKWYNESSSFTYINSKTISIIIINTGVVFKSFWYLDYEMRCHTYLFSSLFYWNVITVNLF